MEISYSVKQFLNYGEHESTVAHAGEERGAESLLPLVERCWLWYWLPPLPSVWQSLASPYCVWERLTLFGHTDDGGEITKATDLGSLQPEL